MEAKELANKLTEYTDIKERVEQLIKIVENPDDEITLADVAEQRLIDELQILGRNTLQDWAKKQAKKSAVQLEKRVKTAKKDRGQEDRGDRGQVSIYDLLISHKGCG